MHTLLAPTNLSRLSIGSTDANGQHTIRRFVNNGQGELILQPVEPDGTDALDNRPGDPPAPPTLDLDNVIVWNPSAAEFFAQHPQHMTPIQETVVALIDCEEALWKRAL